jgi:hypothetical protein
MAGAPHGKCELTRQGMAWARHGMCKLTVVQAVAPKMRESPSSRVSTYLLLISLFIQPHKQKTELGLETNTIQN